MRILFLIFVFFINTVHSEEIVVDYAYTRADRLWERYDDENMKCYPSNICIKQGHEDKLQTYLEKIAEGCIDLYAKDVPRTLTCWNSECLEFSDKLLRMSPEFYKDGLPSNYIEINEIPDIQTRRVYFEAIKNLNKSCLAQIRLAEKAYKTEQSIAFVKGQNEDCQKALAFYVMNDNEWKNSWITYYLNTKDYFNDDKVFAAIKNSAPECILGQGESVFQVDAAKVIANYNAEEKRLSDERASKIAIEKAKIKLAVQKRELASQQYNQQQKREMIRLDLKAKKIGYKGIYNYLDIGGVMLSAMTGVEPVQVKGWLIKPSLTDNYTVLQVTSEKIIYRTCEFCPTIITPRILNKTYVDGQYFDHNYYYEYIGVEIYNNVAGSTSTGLFFKPVPL